MRRTKLLKSYDQLLDLAQSKGLHVFEDQPLNKLRGYINMNIVLLRDGLSELDKRAVLTEEITHFDINYGDITQNLRQELKAHRRVIESNISLYELLDAIIDNKENATPYNVATTLEVPEWLYKEIYEFYSNLPFRNLYYRNHLIKFNPLHVDPIEE